MSTSLPCFFRSLEWTQLSSFNLPWNFQVVFIPEFPPMPSISKQCLSFHKKRELHHQIRTYQLSTICSPTILHKFRHLTNVVNDILLMNSQDMATEENWMTTIIAFYLNKKFDPKSLWTFPRVVGINFCRPPQAQTRDSLHKCSKLNQNIGRNANWTEIYDPAHTDSRLSVKGFSHGSQYSINLKLNRFYFFSHCPQVTSLSSP